MTSGIFEIVYNLSTKKKRKFHLSKTSTAQDQRV